VSGPPEAPGPTGPEGAGSARALDALRPHPLADLFRMEPGRPALVVGVRMAVVITVPMAIGASLGQLVPATSICLGALNAGMADAGGARSSRWHALMAATVLNAAAISLGTVVGHSIGVAVPLMFVIAVACGLANLFGNVSTNVGFVVSVLFMVGVGTPGSGAVAVERLWLVLLGGVWAIVVVLVVWPVRPFAVASSAVADACDSLRAALDELARSLVRSDGRDAPALDQTHLVRAKIEAARSLLASTRSQRRGDSWTGTRLLSLLHHLGRLLDEAEGLVATRSTVDRLSAGSESLAAIQGVLSGIAATLGELSGPIRHRDGSAALPTVLPLEWEVEELEDRWAAARDVADLPSMDLLRPSIASLSAMTSTLRAMTGVMSAPPGTLGVAAPDDRSATSPRASMASGLATWRERAARSVGTIRSNLTLDSVVSRHALRFGTTAAVGLAIAMATHLVKGYWVTLTIAVVLRPYAAATVSRSLLRVAGTVVGAALTALVMVSVTDRTELIVLMFVLSVLAFSLMPLNYALGVVFLTPLIIVLISITSTGGWELAGHRILNTLIGGALALLGGYVLWPGANRSVLVDAIERSLGANRRFVGAVFAGIGDAPDGHRGAEIQSLHLAAGLATDNAVAGLQQVLGETPAHRGPVEVEWAMTEGSRSLFVGASALEAHLAQMPGACRDPVVAEIGALVDQELDAITTALRERRVPEGDDRPARLATATASLRHEAVGVRRARQGELQEGHTAATPASRELGDLWIISLAATRMVDALHDLRREAGELDADAGSGPARK
jgi:uncharacterized membrane protein YccC